RPDSIIAGPSGTLLYTDINANVAGLVDAASGGVTAVPVTAPGSLVADPDGNGVWFISNGSGSIYHLDPTNFINPLTSHPIPGDNHSPIGIAAGADKAIWFTDAGTASIGRLDRSTGNVTETPVPSGQTPYLITPGPAGTLWFTET